MSPPRRHTTDVHYHSQVYRSAQILPALRSIPFISTGTPMKHLWMSRLSISWWDLRWSHNFQHACWVGPISESHLTGHLRWGVPVFCDAENIWIRQEDSLRVVLDVLESHITEDVSLRISKVRCVVRICLCSATSTDVNDAFTF